MGAVKWIVVWGLVSTLSAIIGGFVANYKRRDPSSWAAWCFIFPPLLIVIALLSTNIGPRPRRPSFDQDDMTAN
jgi:uncharacterized membrane protein YfcA